MFSDNMIPFVIPLVILFLTKLVFKDRQNISSMICNFLIVFLYTEKA
jgi:hypothetical protein